MLAVLGLALVAAAADAPVSRVVGNKRMILVQTPAGLGASTVSMLDGSRTGGYWDLGERAGLLRPQAKRVVLLGMGGGEMLRAARRALPKADLLGIDNDPRMLRAALTEFRVDRFGARTQLGDAFVLVKQLRGVDVLLVDLFVGDAMPTAELGRAFWLDVELAIGPKSLVVVNVYPAHLVADVEQLLEASRLHVFERYTQDGCTVLFAEPRT